MSEMTTPPKFISAVVLILFIGTIVMTLSEGSLVVLIVGTALTLFAARAMIGIGRE